MQFWNIERCPLVNRSRLPLPTPTPRVNIQTTITFRQEVVSRSSFNLLHDLYNSVLSFLPGVSYHVDKAKYIFSYKFNNDFRDLSVVVLAYGPSPNGRGVLVVSQWKVGNQ